MLPCLTPSFPTRLSSDLPFARRIEHPRGPQNERFRCVLSRSRDRRSGAQEEEGGGDRARDTVGGFPHDSSPATSGRRAPGSHAVDYTSGETPTRSEEHTSELQSLMRISYAVFCLK